MSHCLAHPQEPAPLETGKDLSAHGRDWDASSEGCIAVPVTFDALREHWSAADRRLTWHCLFMLPDWLEQWWSSFGLGREPLLLEVRRGDRLLGIAPLQVEGDTARFMGSTDLCDYGDFIVGESAEAEFFEALLYLVHRQGIRRLDLHGLRPDSATLRALPAAAAAHGCECLLNQEDVSFELALPADWQSYLAVLSGKERHEIHRKIRRLEERSPYGLQVIESPHEVDAAMDDFLDLFRQSRAEKREFLTESRERFLRRVVPALARHHLVKLCFLDVASVRTAAALCFDHKGSVYLYNSGLNPDYRELSVGLICKILTLRHSILLGRAVYDFLKGSETYKHRLGAQQIPLLRCQVELD
jgi:CelD/BcsL family acetyltransferase involved in cellulose biosynthesis